MKGWLFVLAAACSKPGPEPTPEPPPLLPADELQRADEACTGYVQKVCACADNVAAKKQDCALSKAIPEAIAVARRLAANPKADREDARQAADNVRKTVKQCIELTAKLPSEGCP